MSRPRSSAGSGGGRDPAGRGGVGGCQHDEETVLGRDEYVAVTEPVEDDRFQGADRRVGIGQPPARRGQGDLVNAGEVEPERLGPFHQGAQVGVAAQQVVDQFAAQRLFPADQVAARDRVAFGERRDRVVDDVQHRGGGGAHRLAVAGAHHHRQVLPQPPRRRQVQLHHPPGGDALLRGPPAEQTHRLQLAALGPASVDGRVGQQRQVLTEQLHRHTPGVPAGTLRDTDKPRVVRLRFRRWALAAPPGAVRPCPPPRTRLAPQTTDAFDASCAVPAGSGGNPTGWLGRPWWPTGPMMVTGRLLRQPAPCRTSGVVDLAVPVRLSPARYRGAQSL